MSPWQPGWLRHQCDLTVSIGFGYYTVPTPLNVSTHTVTTNPRQRNTPLVPRAPDASPVSVGGQDGHDEIGNRANPDINDSTAHRDEQNHQLVVVSCNVQKSAQNTIVLLEQHQDADLVLIQEAYWGHIKVVPSTTQKDGDVYENTVAHRNFLCLGTSPQSRVVTYVHVRWRQARPQLHTALLNHPDVALLSIDVAREKFYFVNIYNDCVTHAGSKLLCDYAERLPNIKFIVGDFNLRHEQWETAHGPSRASNTAAANELIHAAQSELNLTLLNNKDDYTWLSHNAALRPRVLDLFWLSHALVPQLNAFEVDLAARHNGDHAVLCARIDLEASPATNPRIPLESEAEQQYLQCVRNARDAVMITHPHPQSEDDIQATLNFLEARLGEAWEEHARPARPSKHAKSWWNAECSDKKRARAHLRSTVRDLGPMAPDELRDELESTTKSLKRTIRKAKRMHFNKVIEATQSKKIWDLVPWTKPRCTNTFASIVNDRGEPCLDDESLRDAFHHQFQPRGSFENGLNAEQLCATYPQLPERSFPPISAKEILENLALTSNRSAPGPDHFSWRWLKAIMTPEFAAWLGQLFSACIAVHSCPTVFKHSATVVIPKPGKPDYSKPKAYRPIVLLNCIGKLLEKTIAKRLQFDAQKFGIAHPCQFGGTTRTTQHSTTDAGVALVHNIKQAWKQGLDSTILLFDVSQFYPSVNHEILCTTLRRQGFNADLCSFITDYLHHRSTQYVINGQPTNATNVDQGLGQGSSLSPVLSALYIAPVLHLRSPTSSIPFGNPSTQFFVDDGLLHVAAPRDPSIPVEGDQLQLNCAVIAHHFQLLARDLHSIGLRVEPDKYELMHFTRKSQPWTPDQPLGPSVVFRTPGPDNPIARIEPTARLRYLGFILDPKLSWKLHIKHYVTKASSTISAIRMLGNSVRGLSPAHKRRLYLTNVLPVLLYGAQLWWHPSWKGTKWIKTMLDSAQTKAARWITGAFRTTRAGPTQALAGLVPIRSQVDRYMENAAYRVVTLPESHPTRAALPPEWIVNNINITAPFPITGLPSRDAVTPLTHIHHIAAKVTERFDHLNPECRPGERVLDQFPGQVHFHLSAPTKSSPDFQSWVDNYLIPVLDIIQRRNDSLLLFTDGSRRTHRRLHGPRAGAAWLVMRKRKIICDGHFACGTASIFDAEMAAIARGLRAVTLATKPSDRTIHIFTDNKAAASRILDPAAGTAQLLAVSACQTVRAFLSRSNLHQVHVHWCPAHANIDANEIVDRSAKTAAAQQDHPDVFTLATARTESRQRAQSAWTSNDCAVAPAMGRHFLAPAKVLEPDRRLTNSIMFKKFGQSTSEFARVTRFLTGHAPIGEYRARFNIPGPISCACGAPVESREHMVFDCPLWVRPWTRQRLDHLAHQDALNFDQDRVYNMRLDADKAFTFLKLNPLAASFDWLSLAETLRSQRAGGPVDQSAYAIAVRHTAGRRSAWRAWRATNPARDPEEFVNDIAPPPRPAEPG